MTIDLTKKQQRPVPPPAGKPPQMRMPLPQGQLIRPNMVTEDERKILEAGGWKEGDPVPANLADILAQNAEEMTNPDLMPPPGDPKTPPLRVEETRIEDLDPAEQARFKQVMASVLGQANVAMKAAEELAKSQGLDPSVLAAAKLAGDDTYVVNDLQAAEYDTGVKKESPKVTYASSNEDEDAEDRCKRCGWPRDKADLIQITEADRDLFLEAILGGKQFHKIIELYNGKIKLVVRTLRPKEHDACWRQVTLDWGNGRVKNLLDQGEMLTRYRAVLQLVALEGLDKPVHLPASMDEWQALCQPSGTDTFLVQALEAFENMTVSECLNRLIVGHIADFNTLVTKLEANALNPDF